MDTIDAWCRTLIESDDLDWKLDPPPRPSDLSPEPQWPAVEVDHLVPGRPPGMEVVERAERIPRGKALREPAARARLLHIFLHHELQAAELFAWAVIRFPHAPVEFRRGLLRLVDDELRHARLYRDRLAVLGVRFGDHPVRDWFWSKARDCADERMFVALMGIGFEGANLEHAERFERELSAAGDSDSAAILARIGREEVAHVRFASRWFTTFDGGSPEDGPDFERWAAALPAPLTPSVMRGRPLERAQRARAGQSVDFLDRLEAAGSNTSKRSPRQAGPVAPRNPR